SRLGKQFRNVMLYPKLTFHGFHPDFLFMRSADGKLIRSGCGSYHSKIVAVAFSMGLPESRAEKLFNAFVFTRLGYFGKFAPWKSIFLDRAAAIGYDLTDDFDGWLKN